MTARTVFVLLLAMLAGGPLGAQTAREWYVSPEGRAGNDGSQDRPIDLASGLDGRRVAPGSTVWLGEGIYRGVFRSTLAGTAAAPITVRGRPGERAVIADNRPRATGGTINVFGAWTIYRDFEVTNLSETRTHGRDFRPMGFEVQAPNTKFINLTIHDTGMGFGFWKEAVDAELYGNVIFNSGSENTTSDSRHGHGIYTQNDGGTKLVRDNILLNQYGYGIHAYPNPGGQTGFRFEGNVVADSGAANPSGTARYSNILISAYKPYRADRIELIDNYTYLSPRETLRGVYRDANLCLGCADPQTHGDVVMRGNYLVGGAPVAIVSGFTRVTMRGNTLVGNHAMVAVRAPTPAAMKTWDWDDNDYLGSGPPERRDVLFGIETRVLTRDEWKSRTGFDATSRFVPTRPTGSKVVVRANHYEPGRGHVIVYNWDRQPRLPVDLGAVLQRGARYEIRSAMDYLGAPVATGTYDGRPVTLPLDRLRVTEPLGGRLTKSSTLGEFAVFVVRTVSGDRTTTAPPAATPPATAPPAPVPPPRVAVPRNAPSLVRFVGRYVSTRPTGDVQIALVAGRLTAQIHNEPGRPVFGLTAVSASRFRIDGTPDGFFADFALDGDTVRSLTLERGSAAPVTLRPR